MTTAPKRSGVIYRILCTANGRAYIGSSVEAKRRFYLHRLDLEAGRHHSPRLQAAWNKYGADAFVFEVVEHVEDALFLVGREQNWLWNNESTLLNCSMVAGSPLGVKRTEEQKQRMKASKQAFYATEEGKAHLANMHAKNRGRVMTDEERERRSQSARGKIAGRPKSEAHKAALKAAWVIRKARAAS